jgi:hypothetical protein
LSIDVGLKAYGIFGGGVFTLGWSAISIRFAEAPRLVIAAYRMLGAMVLGPGAYTAGQSRALDTRRGLSSRQRWPGGCCPSLWEACGRPPHGSWQASPEESPEVLPAGENPVFNLVDLA